MWCAMWASDHALAHLIHSYSAVFCCWLLFVFYYRFQAETAINFIEQIAILLSELQFEESLKGSNHNWDG